MKQAIPAQGKKPMYAEWCNNFFNSGVYTELERKNEKDKVNELVNDKHSACH